jgi:prevent-host-death family protein
LLNPTLEHRRGGAGNDAGALFFGDPEATRRKELVGDPHRYALAWRGQGELDLVNQTKSYRCMVIVNVHEAKTHLSRILERVAAGEEVILAKAGKPVARIVPYEAPSRRRTFGYARGRIEIPDSFFEPLPDDELQGWEG